MLVFGENGIVRFEAVLVEESLVAGDNLSALDYHREGRNAEEAHPTACMSSNGFSRTRSLYGAILAKRLLNMRVLSVFMSVGAGTASCVQGWGETDQG